MFCFNYTTSLDMDNNSFYDNDGNESAVPRAMILDSLYPGRFSVPINGYMSPIVILITVVTNTFVIAVLLKTHMRTPTNALLYFRYQFSYTSLLWVIMWIPLPYNWCYSYKYLFENIPTIFHTASIWLTVGLAAQRYVYICHSIQARTWCTIPNVIRATLIVYVVAILSQVSRFVDFLFEPIPVISKMHPNISYVGCVEMLKPWFSDNMDLYLNIYYWFRVIFIHLVPCISLVVLNGLLISAMRNAQLRRMQLLKQNKKSESKLKDSNFTTLMLVAVVGLFLLVEFPLGIIMTIYIADNTFQLALFIPETYSVMTKIDHNIKLFYIFELPSEFCLLLCNEQAV
ncbi:hypothetical protein ACJMK2_024537 [Sinanodonta woodiana]|uniref:G-protein coupled receptors family 1 profile domain-containing protein n=1 Tax=Sinanodonta woodiana TaxID=1069815 RepID=A0ABD3XHL0_SINWO